jgi:hypothetical protein
MCLRRPRAAFSPRAAGSRGNEKHAYRIGSRDGLVKSSRLRKRDSHARSMKRRFKAFQAFQGSEPLKLCFKGSDPLIALNAAEVI